jgi:chloramphenicol-sensitive protein RarD
VGPGAGRTLSTSGVLFALAAYAAWGFTPIYWKQLEALGASEIIAHRVLGSLLLVGVVLLLLRQYGALRVSLSHPRERRLLLASAVLLAINWWIFVWAVNTNQIVETSLGYYLTPLLNVAFGMGLYRERLSRPQAIAVGLAAAGVFYMAYDFGRLPWLSLALGVTFALYGVLRKATTVSSIGGLGVECCVMAIPALVYLWRLEASGSGTLLRLEEFPPLTLPLLLGCGVVTAFPLVCFASAARRLPLTAIGFFQYIAPSLSLGVAVWLYDEDFTVTHGVTFGLIWAALALYSWESFGFRRVDVSPDH